MDSAGLRLERGGGQTVFLSCACFSIAQPVLGIHRHTLHQIEAEYHSYLMTSAVKFMVVEVQNHERNKNMNFLTFIFRTQISH